MTSLTISWSPTPLLAIALYLLYRCYRYCQFKPLPGIAYNKNAAYTLAGDIPALIKAKVNGVNLLEWTVSHATKHNSPVFQMFLRPLSRPWVVVTDYAEARDILLRRTQDFDRSPAMFDVIGGVGPEFHLVFASDDPRFKIHRNLLKDLSTPTFYHQVTGPRVYTSVSNLIHLWSLKAGLADGRPFDAIEDIVNNAMDSITALAFGLDAEQSVNASRGRRLANSSDNANVKPNNDGSVDFALLAKSEIYAALSYLMDSINASLRSPMPKLTHWWFRQSSSYRQACSLKEEMIDTRMEEGVARLKVGDNTQRCALDNFLQREIAAAARAGRTPDYKSRMIKDELAGFMLAGYDTTAATVAWSFKYLTTYQGVQLKLRSLLRNAYPQAVLEAREPTVDEIIKSNIPYLEATMQEMNRCGRIFSGILRRAMVDTTILGHDIPKGTDIILPTFGPSHQTPAFSIPDDLRSPTFHAAKAYAGSWVPAEGGMFKPERWLKNDEKGMEYFDANAGPVLAFSLGPRGCWGKKLAHLQMKVLITLALWNFELQEVEGEFASFEAVNDFVRRPKHVYLKLKAIER